jgi:hypothetical protein
MHGPRSRSLARATAFACAALAAFPLAPSPSLAQSQPATLPELPWTLTARDWTPVNQPRAELLDKVEAIVNGLAPFQYWNPSNSADVRNGEITDPYRGSEWQYATPYFAFASSVVLSEGRSPALLTAAIRAMNHATADIAGLDNPTEDNGKPNDGHGEFMLAPLAKALARFELMQTGGQFPALTPELLQTWRTRLGTDRSRILNGNLNNWRTYAMKGEWQRARAGLIDKTTAVNWIESSWLTSSGGNQRERFVRDRESLAQTPFFLLYHDDDPQSRQNFAYHGGALGNLYDMIVQGYDGPSRADMSAILEHSLRSSLLLMAGSGDAPAAGRTGNHIWNDIVYANDFDHAAETAWAAGDVRRAGQFRRAAMLAFRSAWRFQTDRGYFSVTKNHFHPSLNVGYAAWSALTNYNGYTQIHSSEAYLARQTAIPERPTPAEIGGYAAVLDPQFDHVFLNAGGLSVQLCTDGANTNANTGNQLWHTLGLLRFSRPGWDSRLSPGDGWINVNASRAISFSPAFLEGGVWKPVAQLPGRFVGTYTSQFVHPLLLRGTLRIAPRANQTGPTIELKLSVTPDGVLVDTTRVSGTEPIATVWPLLAYDGKHVLDTAINPRSAITSFPALSPSPATRQAETPADTTLSGGATTVTSSTLGARGTGYVTFPSAGATATWTSVPGGDGGRGAISFRYSLASTVSRTLTLRVNDVPRTLTFDSTATLGDWHSQIIPVTLAPGAANTISLEASANGNIALDELAVHPADAGRPAPDEQAFLALDPTVAIDASATPFRTPAGDLLPLLASGSADTQGTYIYPRSATDPAAETVRASFTRTATGYATSLARVEGDLYVGRTAAGGRGSALDLDADGTPELGLSEVSDFVARHADGAITALEADRFVTATLAGRAYSLAPYTPLSPPADPATPVWHYRPATLARERDELTFTFTPAAADREVLLGLATPEADAPAVLLGTLRFGADGLLSALDAPATAFAYQAGVSHRVRLVLDAPAGRYSLYVKPDGSPERRLVALAPLPAGFTTPAALTALAWRSADALPAPGPVSGLVTPAPTPIAFINFQTPSSATPPGYLADTGAVFGARGNGLNYGWIGGDNSTYTRDRDAANSPDQRYDTFNHLGFGNPQTYTNTWELALPNGTYRVRVVAGDPSYTDSFYHILAEGVTVINANATPRWREGTVDVEVGDGRLTVSNGPSGLRNKICFIEATTVPQDPYPYRSYAAWADTTLPPADAAPAQDPDGDGLANLLEYALGTSPLAPDTAPVARPSPLDQRLEITFPITPSATNDVTYEVQQSTDLASWQTVWSSATDADLSSPLVTTTTVDGRPWLTARSTLPASTPRVFLRLRVTTP